MANWIKTEGNPPATGLIVKGLWAPSQIWQAVGSTSLPYGWVEATGWQCEEGCWHITAGIPAVVPPPIYYALIDGHPPVPSGH